MPLTFVAMDEQNAHKNDGDNDGNTTENHVADKNHGDNDGKARMERCLQQQIRKKTLYDIRLELKRKQCGEATT